MIKITPFIFLLLNFSLVSWGKAVPSSGTLTKKPTVVALYTGTGLETGEDVEDLSGVVRFAYDQFDLENHTKTDVNIVGVDDQDNAAHAVEELKKLPDRPLTVIGPVYSNVAMGLKGYINSAHIPLLSVFATHNDLTKNSEYIFRICASNRRLVKTMADFLIPEAQKHHLNINTFKDLSDDYSMDLADNFRQNISGVNIGYNEILFRGVGGIERLQDLNAKIWTPTKSDVIFLPTRDSVAGHIIAALESEPYMVASIDPVTFLNITKRIKKEKTHIRLVVTAQWLPGKSEYSKKIEDAFQKRFNHPMTITTALAYDAAYTSAAAYHRSLEKTISLAKALRDGTRLTGVTGTIYLGHDGERIFSEQFLKEDFIE